VTGLEAKRRLRAALILVGDRADVSESELVSWLRLEQAVISRKRSVAGRERVKTGERGEDGRLRAGPANRPAPGPANSTVLGQQTTSKPLDAGAPPSPPHTPPLPASTLSSGSKSSVSEEILSSSVAPKDLEASAREGERRPTSVPLNLVDKARAAGVFEMLRDGLERAGRRVTIAQLEDAAREFVSYWSIGEGMGREHTSWMRKMREHVRRSALADRLAAPGAIEHAENRRAQAEDDRVLRLVREGAQREQREREASGGVVIAPAPAQAQRRRAADNGEQVALANSALASLRGAQRKDGGVS
jgi:hypothetical protein